MYHEILTRTEEPGFDSVVPATEGGTGADSREQALAALGAIDRNAVNTAQGPLAVGKDGVIASESIDFASLAPASVSGKKTIKAGSTEDYYITGYDAFTGYSLEPLRGSVLRNGAMVRYTAPQIAGAGGFVLNGRTIRLAISPGEGGEVKVYAPAIEYPMAGDTKTPWRGFTIVATGFVAGGDQTHVASDWEIATDRDFTNVVWSSHNDVDHLLECPVPALQPTTQYYARVRHEGSISGKGAWSEAVGFKTSINFPSALIQSIDLSAYSGGVAMAVSGDGKVIAISCSSSGQSNPGTGVVIIYELENGLYVERFKLYRSPTSSIYFGKTPILNEDGSKILVGSGTVNTSDGAYGATMYKRNGNVWSLYATFATGAPAGGTTVGMNRAADRVVVADWPNSRAIIWEQNAGGTWDVKYTPSNLGTYGFIVVNMDNEGESVISFTNSYSGPYVYNRGSGTWSYKNFYGPGNSSSVLSASGNYLLIANSGVTYLATKNPDGTFTKDSSKSYAGTPGFMSRDEKFMVLNTASGPNVYSRNPTTDAWEAVAIDVQIDGNIANNTSDDCSTILAYKGNSVNVYR